MYIAIVYYPSCDVMDFEINLFFLIEPFFYMTENFKIDEMLPKIVADLRVRL